jgi:DNA-binding NtrC family response regulator
VDAAERKNSRILIVDDDPITRFSLREMLTDEGYTVQTADDAEAALKILENGPCDLILADISMPGLSGFDLLKAVKHQYPGIIVMLITGFGSIEDAVSGMKMGAYDYLTKPLNDDRVKVTIERALEQKHLRLENLELKQKLADKFHFNSLVGDDARMQKIFDLLSIVADTEATILINGASGTGKSTLARAIHYHSRRKDLPLVEISCGALSENLLESELFGHIKGSFTSAVSDKAGKIEKAKDGTVFLDEIDTLSLRLQVKLLRFLQERKFERVGSNDTIHSNVRIIAAANQDLRQSVARGEFREDLFYRLNVVSIQLPSLADRLGDLPLFIEYFIEKYNKINSRKVRGVSGEVMERLLSYGWPGNVRELENAIERAVILCAGEYLTFDLLPDYLRETAFEKGSDGLVSLTAATEIATKNAIAKTLKYFRGNRNKTAEILGIDRTTLYKKMKRYGLLDENFGGSTKT